ncbi:MAG: biotin synthase BioB [Oscillibacter ruminantium]|uniref:biotin synthase BioB n=1 Tax=Oscillibacter ruminantium TaxID=1263547 RepID=UPI002B1F6C20|nr:biotin synthase BioB [Oscillibacter ruminantium]MEA5041993.1 biotin synthase BioB [Oscillibacter ruminantium]
MNVTSELKNRVLSGELLNRESILTLCQAPLDELCSAADEIRAHFCGNGFDLCTIVNGKSGRCSEDCKYCAQSAHYQTHVEEYSLLGTDEIVRQAKHHAEQGVLRYSIVTSGRKLGDADISQVCESIRAIKASTDIEVCVSFGLLDEAAFRKVKAAGASRVHCNLESSRSYFPTVCTTHTYDEKIETLQAARRAGLSICSGGIMGLGESMEDRIDMALTLRELGVKSIPINFLNPIPGTPFADNAPLSDEEKRRIVAIYRFILPNTSIRLAGGRGLIVDKGEGCFRSGANAAISGDMLTTAGITVETDLQLLDRLGYQARLWNE